MAPETTLSTTNSNHEPSHELDKAQVSCFPPKSVRPPEPPNKIKTLKASTALLKHIQSEAQTKETLSTTRNLLADPTDSSSDTSLPISDPIWLVLTTKKHIVDQKRLKPGKIPLPHSLNSSPTVTICLITADPQRAFKDTIAHPSFPPELTPRITRIVGITKLKARYKSFESRRQLLAEHDVFLADSRVITMLPNLLGKVFYKGPKRPIPVNLEPFKPKDRTTGKRRSKPISSASTETLRAIASPQKVAQEIQRALASTQVQLSPSTTTSVRVGLASFTPDQIAENVEAVVHGMVEKFVTKGWRNVRSVHIKGPNTLALPIWLAQELWVAESDVLEEAEATRRVEAGRQSGKRKAREVEPGKEKGLEANGQRIEDAKSQGKAQKRRKLLTDGQDRDEQQASGQKVKKRKAIDADLSAEMQARREKLRAQKKDIREEVETREAASTGKEAEGEEDVRVVTKKPKREKK